MSSSGNPTESNGARSKDEHAVHRRIVHRVQLWQAVLGAAGLIAWWFAEGIPQAASFAAGAISSAASFWLLDRFTGAVTGKSTSATGLVMAVFRLLVIGGALFVIMRSYSLQAVPAACGIAVTIVAITIEAVREIFYA